jgi:putative peptide zinc metalloprotease protein
VEYKVDAGAGAPKKPEYLPLFRKDLVMHKGPDDADGSPTYALYDPVKAQYFKVGWAEYLIFESLRPHMTPKELIEIVESKAPLHITVDEVKEFFEEAMKQGLLIKRYSSEEIIKQAESKKISWFTWVLHHYLYIRIPLFDPDEFLTRTIDYVRPLFSQTAMLIYFILSMTGLVLILGRLEEFLHTFTYFFNFQGFIAYAVAITLIKVVHEFGHAYTAKYYGVHVPTIGVALIVLWPVLYTDITDGWKLSDRRERLNISMAGVIVETVLGGLATLAWAFSSPGIWQSVFFIVASVSWISTLLVNLNPALRFDGYYVLCDLWGVDNLQSRAFACTRWKLREVFLGLKVAPPESLISGRLGGYMLYSIYTWIYRLVLYVGVAIFVYYHFGKALGIFLFFLEIIVFILWPIESELEYLFKARSQLTWNKRSIFTTCFITLLAGWFFLPFPHNVQFNGVVSSEGTQTIYVPEDGIVDKVFVKEGDQVDRGQELLRMKSEDLQNKLKQALLERSETEKRLFAAQNTNESNVVIKSLEAQLEAASANVQRMRNALLYLDIRSDLKGTVYLWDQNVKAGDALAKDFAIGKIANFDKLFVEGFVPEADVETLTVGSLVTFNPVGYVDDVNGKIIRILPIKDRVLLYPQLASVNQGPLPVNVDSATKKAFLVESFYLVVIQLDEGESRLGIGLTGVIDYKGPWRSKFRQMMRKVIALFRQEGNV